MGSSDLLPSLRLLAVIVLYKVKPCESVTLTSLRKAIAATDPERATIQILLYDNTPNGQDPGAIPAGERYRADRDNGGLGAAYNYAITVAKEESCDWLLTLDQDTSLPEDFLHKLCQAIWTVSGSGDVAAIVPQIWSDGRLLSPWTPTKNWAIVRRYPEGFVGIPSERVYATNSASTMRVSALESLSGYDPRFRLDFSDLVMYHRLQIRRFRVLIAGNIRVEHELSGFDLKNRSSPARFAEFHAAEEAFYDEYLGAASGVVLQLRMIHRLLYRLWSQGGNFSYFRIGFRFFCRRLFYSRKHRRATREQLAGNRVG